MLLLVSGPISLPRQRAIQHCDVLRKGKRYYHQQTEQARAAFSADCKCRIELEVHVPVQYKMCCRRGSSNVWQATLFAFVLQAYQAVLAQTINTDVQALTEIKNALLPPATSDDVLRMYNWTTSVDPCGSAYCGVSACSWHFSSALYAESSRCNWGGICCNSWYVIGIDLPPRQLQTSSSLSTLIDALSSMKNHLKLLKMDKQG